MVTIHKAVVFINVIAPETVKTEERVMTYLGVVQWHLELVEVQPVLGFFRAQVVVEVASSESKRMELTIRVE